MTRNIIVIAFVLLVVCNGIIIVGARKIRRKQASVQSKYVVNRIPSSLTSLLSLNPSFNEPSYMRHVNTKAHPPGKDLVLVCKTGGVKPIKYTWLFNGTPSEQLKRKRFKFSADRSMLKIKRIRDSDVGVYTCEASNAYGNLSFDYNIRLQAKQSKPVFYDYVLMKRRRIAIRPTRDTVRFECQADGQGIIHYIWMKDGNPFKHIKPPMIGRREMDNVQSSVDSTITPGDLVLKNLKIYDGGLYTCIAINKHGNASFTYELRILRKFSGGPPKVIPFTRPRQLTVPVGSNVSFDCLEIISGTLPDVRWFQLYSEINNQRVLPPKIPDYINWHDINNPEHRFNVNYISPRSYATFLVKPSHVQPKNPYLYDDTNPSGLRLNLVNVTTNHTGVYACYVSNLDGSDYALFYLRVDDTQKPNV